MLAGVLYGMLVFKWSHHVLITATAFIGSFLALFAVGLIAGHYPNPFILVKLMENGLLHNIDPIFYAYFGANLVLFVIGCAFQYKMHKRQALLKSELNATTSQDG